MREAGRCCGRPPRRADLHSAAHCADAFPSRFARKGRAEASSAAAAAGSPPWLLETLCFAVGPSARSPPSSPLQLYPRPCWTRDPKSCRDVPDSCCSCLGQVAAQGLGDVPAAADRERGRVAKLCPGPLMMAHHGAAIWRRRNATMFCAIMRRKTANSHLFCDVAKPSGGRSSAATWVAPRGTC